VAWDFRPADQWRRECAAASRRCNRASERTARRASLTS
jgi:hypothetical protein